MSRLHIHGTWAIVLLVLIGAGKPCHAWLYDGGEPSISGPSVKDGSATVWASQQFTVASDSWATGFGAAVARAFGNASMGYDLYLTDTLVDVPSHAIASGTIRPVGAGYRYCFINPPDPVLLLGGHSYYLTLAPNSNNFSGSVCWSYKSGAYYGAGSGDYGDSWFQLVLPLSVRVDGYLVPEPSALAALIVGLLGLLAVRRSCVFRSGANQEL